jgi:hypothetical protein
MILRFAFSLLLFAATMANAFDVAVLHGEWAAHQQRPDEPDRYFYLRINKDLSGVLVRTNNDDTIARRFAPEQAHVRQSYLELTLDNNETAILWGWKQNNGLRRVNGLLFEEGSPQAVRNMLPVPLEYLDKQHQLRAQPRINAIIEDFADR